MVICRRKPSIRDRVQTSSTRAGRYRRGAFDFVLVVALLQLRTGFNGVFVRFKEKKVLDPHQRFQCELQRTWRFDRLSQFRAQELFLTRRSSTACVFHCPFSVWRSVQHPR